jgi:hypothetical protein
MSNFSLDQFLAACGASGPLHLTVEHGGATSEYVLPQPFALAGSDPRADLRMADSRLPRRAAFLQVLGGRLLGLDLTVDAAGRNGRYPPHHWLPPGQAWPCGGFTIRLATDGISGTPSSLRREDLPAAALEIVGGSGGVCEYTLKAPIVLIGKSGQCQVRLRDPTVSRFHCALINTPAGLWAVDLLGRSGIAVNGRMSRAARLEHGDELRVGSFVLRALAGRSVNSDAAVGAEQSLARLPLPPVVADLLPAVPNVPGDIAAGGLGPVVSLLAAMQQQMAEQHRLAMSGVIDAFRRMHNDQMQMIWGELAEFRRLTEEMTSLKASLAKLPVAPSGANSPPPPPRVSEPVTAPKPAPVFDRPPMDRPAPAPRPSTPDRTREAGTAKTNPVIGDVHAWLSQRVAEVQKEREGRWQKIVSFLTGAPQ